MKSLVNRLLRKNNRVDSPENFARASWLLERFLSERNFTVGFKGYYRNQSDNDRKPGPQVPFLIGLDEIGLKELEKRKIDAITISPLLSSEEYEGIKLSYVRGYIEERELFFVNSPLTPTRQIKAFKEIDFANLPNLSPENINYYQKEFQGFSKDPSSTNPKGRVYTGEFRRYYPNEPAIQREGIFQLERVI